MKYKVLVCDLDGSLFVATKLPIVTKRTKELLIKLQQQGVTVVLNTARIIHGCYDLAKDLELDKYGGYLICCNGALVYDMKTDKQVFTTDVNREDAFKMWHHVVDEMHFDFAISQPDLMIATHDKHGFYTDRIACSIDYLNTFTPEKYVKDTIWKCAITMCKEEMDEKYEAVKKAMEEKFDYKFLRTAGEYIDISAKNCDKVHGLNQLFEHLNVSWEEACVLGDGTSDAEMIRLAGYGVTLENGCDLCKQNAKRILPDIKDEGCNVLFEELLGE